MKIIVTDGYVENPGDLSWAPLEALGEVTYYDRIGLTDEDETIRRIGDAEIAVINKAPVTRKVIDSCPNLKLITVLATGYNVVDVAYAKEKGIPVCNVPNYGGYSVSQFTIALMLEACLHIGHHDRTVHEGTCQHANGQNFRQHHIGNPRVQDLPMSRQTVDTVPDNAGDQSTCRRCRCNGEKPFESILHRRTSQPQPLFHSGNILTGDHDFLPVLQDRLKPTAERRSKPFHLCQIQNHRLGNADKIRSGKPLFQFVKFLLQFRHLRFFIRIHTIVHRLKIKHR